LVLLDSSDIATLPERVFFLKSISCRIFNFLVVVVVVFAGQEYRLRARPGFICSPGQGTTKDWVKIGLQRNIKYSFDRARPGLTLIFW
jgi:hypothetical protein